MFADVYCDEQDLYWLNWEMWPSRSVFYLAIANYNCFNKIATYPSVEFHFHPANRRTLCLYLCL